MAPSSDDKENKYNSLSFDELKAECNKRKLEFNDSDSKAILIELLIKDDKKPPNWGKIYARILYHTGMGYDEISHRNIPQIMAILDGAEENIAIKIGMPNVLGGGALDKTSTSSPTPDKPPKLSQFMAFANAFNGI